VLDDPSRKYCDACFPERREATVAKFATVGPAALAKRRDEGTDPAHKEEARRQQRTRAAANANIRANRESERSIPLGDLDLDFEQAILPRIQAVPLSRIREATELSFRDCPLIRRGLKVLHRWHWSNLNHLLVASVVPES
jgi:hypothetical protein